MRSAFLWAISFTLCTGSASAVAEETDVSHVEWMLPGGQSLVCKLSNGPKFAMEGALRCYENQSSDGRQFLGDKVFEFKADTLGPVSVAPAAAPTSTALVTIWESGSAACYIVFGEADGRIRKLFQHCSKGGIETLWEWGDALLFLVTDYEITSARGYYPAKTTVYYWRNGQLQTRTSPWQQRLVTARAMMRADESRSPPRGGSR